MRTLTLASAAALAVASLPFAALAAQPEPAPADPVTTTDPVTTVPMTTAPAPTTTDVRRTFVSNAMVENNMTPTPKDEYPLCKGDQSDSCINPREAGKNWGNRPLDYWPGKPASEIDGPIPAEPPK